MKTLNIGEKVNFKINNERYYGKVIDVLEVDYNEKNNVYVVETDLGVFHLDSNGNPIYV